MKTDLLQMMRSASPGAVYHSGPASSHKSPRGSERGPPFSSAGPEEQTTQRGVFSDERAGGYYLLVFRARAGLDLVSIPAPFMASVSTHPRTMLK